MVHYVLRLNPPRKDFPADISDVEQEAMQHHVAYWRGHSAVGTVIAFGPVVDPKGNWGVAIIEAEDEAKATSLTLSDPVMTAGLGFSYDILPMPTLVLRPNA